MKINTKKSKIMIIDNNKKLTKYEIKCNKISKQYQYTAEYKTLGVIM